MGSKKQKTEIDFSRYRTPELIETISNIISLPGAFKSIFYWAFYGLLGLVFIVGVVLWFSGKSNLFITGLAELYSVPAGTVGGIAVGCAEFVRRSLNNMQNLVNLLLETIAQVTTDVNALSTGEKELPPPRDLAHDVYEQVMLQALREACSGVFGFLGRPVYWFYHLTLNQLVRIAINRVVTDKKIESPPKLLTSTLTTVGSVGKEDGMIVSSLRWTQGKLDFLAGWIKLLVMIPCYIVLSGVISLIVAPLVLIWWFWLSGKAPQVPAPTEPVVSLAQDLFPLLQAICC